MTTAIVRAACAVAAVLLVPALASAADKPAGAVNVLAPDLVNSIVTVVVFGALLAILYFAAWGPIMKGLQAREEAQFQALADAKKAKDEVAAVRAELEAEKKKAAEEARAILEEARRDAEALKVSEREAGQREAQAERERAKRDTATERDAALKDVQAHAVELAVLIATKALRQKVDIGAQEALVNEAIAELKAGASRA
jgi:F-type H+-transporting ATPase subunit b